MFTLRRVDKWWRLERTLIYFGCHPWGPLMYGQPIGAISMEHARTGVLKDLRVVFMMGEHNVVSSGLLYYHCTLVG